MTTVRFLIGLPGCGKSYFRNNFLSQYGEQVVYSTDDELERIAELKDLTYNDAWAHFYNEAEAEANEKLTKAILSNRLVTWDQTNLTSKQRKYKLTNFPERYMKIAHVILPPGNDKELAEHNRRLSSRTGKNIPDHVINNMMKIFDIPSIDEGFYAVHFWNTFNSDACAGPTYVSDIQEIFNCFRYGYERVQSIT